MSRLISRQEAAGLLDCTTQTVTNWVNKGVIKGHVVGNNLMIDRDSIEQYFDSLKDLANMERSIADMKAEIQEIAKDLRATLDEARGCHLTSQTARNIFKNNQLTLISISKENLTEREQRILSEIIKGVSLEEIANVYGLTQERVMQIAVRAANTLSKIDELKLIHNENNTLKEENERLARENEILRKSVQDPNGHAEGINNINLLMDSVFEKCLMDYNLSVRTLNVLKSIDCKTVGDVVRYSQADMMKALNNGKKVFNEIDGFVKELGLNWGMHPEMMTAEELKKWSA